MCKTVLSSVLALTVATASQADTWVIAIPDALQGSVDTLTDPLWSFFLNGLSAGNQYTLLNASEPGQIAHFVVPKDKKYDRAKWRSKHFARENARLAAYLAAIGQGDPVIDPPGVLRHDALNRVDRTSPRKF